MRSPTAAIASLKRLYWRLRDRRERWLDVLGDVAEQAIVLWCLVVKYASFRLTAVRRPRAPSALDARRGGVLLISHYSPPYKSFYGTQRVTKFAKYLSRWGWKITFVTTSPRDASEVDPQCEPLADGIDAHRLPESRLVTRALRGVLVPDDFVPWVRPALTRAREVVAQVRPSVIYATVPPYSNAVAAAILAMETGLPLVTDFRDPWSRIDTGWVIRNPLLRSVSAGIELIVLRVSAAVIMADEAEYADEFFAVCDEEIRSKVSSVLNGYDDDDFAVEQPYGPRSAPDRFVVSYVGSFYDEQGFMNVKHAFEQWEELFPLEVRDIELHYAGPHSQFFDRYRFRPSYLRDHAYVTHQEAIAIRTRSSAQIFSQPPHFKAHVISGKIYEMMRVPVPIVAITNPLGTVARFVLKTGAGVVVDNRDPDAILDGLRKIYLAWAGRASVPQRDERVMSAFSRKSQAEHLSQLLERLINVRSVATPGPDESV